MKEEKKGFTLGKTRSKTILKFPIKGTNMDQEYPS
jgi:hypothetical protein